MEEKGKVEGLNPVDRAKIVSQGYKFSFMVVGALAWPTSVKGTMSLSGCTGGTILVSGDDTRDLRELRIVCRDLLGDK